MDSFRQGKQEALLDLQQALATRCWHVKIPLVWIPVSSLISGGFTYWPSICNRKLSRIPHRKLLVLDTQKTGTAAKCSRSVHACTFSLPPRSRPLSLGAQLGYSWPLDHHDNIRISSAGWPGERFAHAHQPWLQPQLTWVWWVRNSG